MAKTEICKNCSPDGGAIFSRDFGIYTHHATGVDMEDYDWVKVCTNCGHYKPFRKMASRLSFDDIMAQPDDSKLKNKSQRAMFHAFSENGAWALYARICEVYAGECKSKGITEYPVHLHKWCNDYHYNALAKNEKLSAWDVDYHIKKLYEQAEKAKDALEKDFPHSSAGV